MSRKVILYIATSLDGYIARGNGDIDWLEGDGSGPSDDNGYDEFYSQIDTVIMGNATYEQVMGWGEYPYKGVESYVYTRESKESTEDVIFTSEKPKSLIERLKNKEGKDIWIIGGAEVLDLFMKENLIDEYIITLAPVIIGGGIPLFKTNNPEIKLELKETKVFDGFVQAHYIKR